ncbi:MAG: diversity-generating retroelement protein Avd [Acetobacteraceae bacterium]
MTEPANNARATGPALEAMYRVLLWLIPTVEKFPRKQKFVLGDRIEATALDVLELLIGATYTKSRDKMLNEANLGLERLRFFMRLSFELRLIDTRRYEHAARGLDDVGRLVGGWLKADRAHVPA